VLLCHYYIVTRGYLEIEDLYTSRKEGVYHYFHGWNWRAYLAYVVGIAPNFYGFLNNMGVAAPMGVRKMYYFAYEIGLVAAFATYWVANWAFPPQLSFPLREWHEPRDYVRPEERGGAIEGREEDVESGSGSAGEKGMGMDKKVVGVSPVRSLSL